ncbi:hypothetical protein F5148DRAFT_1176423 [Russula earlei]|uniref:Uncharacterized protein n=1 Tax=Russula earlei TaxID=71964 RepID=A0ACC0UIW9_9AGAM|nr:hypothetical protein F5148DRAFT_1176423 [Russula earlei]
MHSASFNQSLCADEPWQITVLRSQNLGMLRPEKSWRPIITMEVDGQHMHEIILGIDGQNPNQRAVMLLHHAHHRTQIKLDVWHKSQSKAKNRKRRHHVASAAMPLGEVMRKQGEDSYVELRLSGVPAARKKSAAQKYQPCASVIIRLRAPPSAMYPPDEPCNDDVFSLVSSERSPSDTLVTPVTDQPENKPPWASAVSEDPPPGLRRRKKAKGYCIYSEEELSGESDYYLSESEAEETNLCGTWEPPMSFDEPPTPHSDSHEIQEHTQERTQEPSTLSIILPSLLPITYVTDNASVTSGASFASSAFDTLTYHRDLREAQVDSDFDRIISRLLSEWYYTGASLLSITAVDTTVFGFSPGNLFTVDGFAKRSLVISSVAAAMGLFIDAWFIFAYSGADVRKFQTLATDIYSSYFFFSISSRLPLVALLVAVLALVGFLGAITWTAWPAAVLVVCVLTGVLISLQFIVYGFHRLALCLAWILRGIWLAARYVASRVRFVLQRGEDIIEGGSQAPAAVVHTIARPASVRAGEHARHTS